MPEEIIAIIMVFVQGILLLGCFVLSSSLLGYLGIRGKIASILAFLISLLLFGTLLLIAGGLLMLRDSRNKSE